MRKLSLAIGVLALAGLLGAHAGAQNILTNPDFTTTAAGWSVSAGAGSLALDTHSGWSAGGDQPGSLTVTNTSPNANGSVTVLSNCVDVPNVTIGRGEVFPYLVVAHVFQAPQGKSGKATVGYEGYSDDACTQRIWAAEKVPVDLAPGTWQQLTMEGAGETGTHALRMYVKLSKNELGGNLDVRLDGMYLGRRLQGDLDGDGRPDVLLAGGHAASPAGASAKPSDSAGSSAQPAVEPGETAPRSAP